MQEKQNHALRKLSSEIAGTSWTSRHKKHAIYTVERDGVNTAVPAMEHLKQVAASLPSIKNGQGRRIYHFENIRRRFMNGKTKDESMRLVNDYCSEVMEIWNKAAEKLNTRHNENNQYHN
ncbi:MAG: hypothetical protein LLF93_03105 [Bacteroidales bacterium]|nr:hypothetical protein [Bacteroidales bacterium]